MTSDSSSDDYVPAGRVIPEGRSSQGRPVDPCWVLFKCPTCGFEVKEDIYGGPVSCELRGDGGHPRTWMRPIRILRDAVEMRKDETQQG